MKKRFCLLLSLLLLCGIFAGCTPAPTETNGRISIVATTFPPYDFARAVAGDLADVTMLIDPGTETHSYDPSPKDIRKIQNADIFLYGGGESDAWMDGILSALDTNAVTVIAMTDLVPLLTERDADVLTCTLDHDHGEHGHGDGDATYDEHVWTSPYHAVTIVDTIRDALVQADPENEAAYTANAAAYTDELRTLAKEFADTVENGVRDTVVFADRYPFLYFSEAFGLRYRAAFAGCARETEPGAQTIAALIDLVKTEHIPAVFYIEFSDERLADAVAEATGCETLLFHSCHNVTRTEWESGVTYVSLMRQNLDNLRKALS